MSAHRPVSRARTILLWALAVFFAGAGVMHFVAPRAYEALVPPQLPAPAVLVYVSGAVEIALGLLLLSPRHRRLAAWGIIATLIAVYPANIHHALSGGLDHPDLPDAFASATLAWLRLPLQLVFIAWAWMFTRERPSSGERARST